MHSLPLVNAKAIHSSGQGTGIGGCGLCGIKADGITGWNEVTQLRERNPHLRSEHNPSDDAQSFPNSQKVSSYFQRSEQLPNRKRGRSRRSPTGENQRSFPLIIAHFNNKALRAFNCFQSLFDANVQVWEFVKRSNYDVRASAKQLR